MSRARQAAKERSRGRQICSTLVRWHTKIAAQKRVPRADITVLTQAGNQRAAKFGVLLDRSLTLDGVRDMCFRYKVTGCELQSYSIGGWGCCCGRRGGLAPAFGRFTPYLDG